MEGKGKKEEIKQIKDTSIPDTVTGNNESVS